MPYYSIYANSILCKCLISKYIAYIIKKNYNILKAAGMKADSNMPNWEDTKILSYTLIILKFNLTNKHIFLLIVNSYYYILIILKIN